MDTKIRVLLVDDHILFSRGIKSLLQRHPEFEVVDDVADGLEAVKRAQSLRPDVVLMDLHMPHVNGRDAVADIVGTLPETRVLMLTVSEDADDLAACLRAGASGYLLKNIDTDALIDAVRRVAKGESVISPAMIGRLVDNVRKPGRSPSLGEGHDRDRLSARETDILARLGCGESNKEIARNLGLAESTVKIHIQSIFRKLGLTSRLQAALYAVENGYCEAH